MLNVFLQAHVPAINFFVAKKLSCPLQDVLSEEFVPLVQCIAKNLLGSANFQSRQKGSKTPFKPIFPAADSYRAMFDGSTFKPRMASSVLTPVLGGIFTPVPKSLCRA